MNILASDFDNTIYFLDDEEKNKKNVEAIREFVAYGNIFCIVTGRNYSDLKILLQENNIAYSYLICDDGAKIFNNVDYCLSTTYLEKEEIEKIKKILDQEQADYYLDDGYNKTENVNDCVKIVVNCKKESVKNHIVEVVKKNADVHIYASRTHVNIIHKTVNKEIALETLIQLENLDRAKLRVIGDNDNDYEMLKTYPGAVIKKHHPILEGLKKQEYETLKDYIEEIMNS